MVQHFVAYVILAIGAVNSCYAFDLEVFQNSNQKPLILAAFIPDDEGAKRKAEEAKRKADEAKRKADEAKRQAAIRQRQADAAEAKRQADAAEAKRQADAAEAKRQADAAEAKRQADAVEAKRQADAAEAKRQADAAEAKRQAEITKRQAEASLVKPLVPNSQSPSAVVVEKKQPDVASRLALTTFKDCPDCPEMVKIPAGKFMMGSVLGEGKSDEYPQHQVSIREFAVARFEVSFKDWEDCLKDGVCDDGKMTVSWRKEENQPLNSASWVDAQNYVKWLSRKTGKQYRLLTEAEWEYVARAGTTTQYWWGNSTQPNGIANCDGCGSTQDNRQTAIVSSFKANPFGLYNITGNVFEWVEDCYHENYNNAPATGTAWSCDNLESYAVKRVLRGGAWSSPIEQVRSASRKKAYPVTQLNDYGVRVARSLP
jgi:formylglycine-generating enzyme required for sulfatase activity